MGFYDESANQQQNQHRSCAFLRAGSNDLEQKNVVQCLYYATSRSPVKFFFHNIFSFPLTASLTSTTITTSTSQQRDGTTTTTRQRASTDIPTLPLPQRRVNTRLPPHEDEELQKQGSRAPDICRAPGMFLFYFFFLNFLPLLMIIFPIQLLLPTWHPMTMNGARDASQALTTDDVLENATHFYLNLYIPYIHVDTFSQIK